SISRVCVGINEFKDYYLNHNYSDNMFNIDGTLNKNYNSSKKTGTIAQIFEDHWNNITFDEKQEILKYRPNADKEIQKIIDCHNKNLGCSVYECPNCHDFVFIDHTCKSRLCSSCGYKYKLLRVENIMNTSYNCKHRQIVFTFAKELWNYFFYPFEYMINLLFKAVNLTIYSILNDTYKTKKNKRKKKYTSKTKYTPGFFAFLHTFGRDLKWHPHIHILIAEIKLGGDMVYKNWNYFNYDALSKRFQKILLDLMSKKLGKSFNGLKTKLFKKYNNGFYVYAEPKKFPNFKAGVEYVTRYCGRCAISENRILNYDGINVTFCYNDHKDNEYHEITVTAIEFIKILLRHLIPYNFKIIRYYGFYRKKHQNHDKMVKMIDEAKRTIRKQFLKHRLCLLKFFNRDPYSCPKCNTIMKYACEIIGGG
ncbi:MAG: transposase, partial [Mycoplasmataceae bacterium]|nr:transposase [Mycoplasmataceae bacterium]